MEGGEVNLFGVDELVVCGAAEVVDVVCEEGVCGGVAG